MEDVHEGEMQVEFEECDTCTILLPLPELHMIIGPSGEKDYLVCTRCDPTVKAQFRGTLEWPPNEG